MDLWKKIRSGYIWNRWKSKESEKAQSEGKIKKEELSIPEDRKQEKKPQEEKIQEEKMPEIHKELARRRGAKQGEQ